MKPPRIPSFYIAAGTRIAVDAGIDPDHLHAVVQGRVRDDALAGLLVAKLHPLVDPADFPGLTTPATKATIATVEPSANVLRSRAKISQEARGNRATRALIDLGMTVTEFAAKVGKKVKRQLARATVQAWFQSPSSPYYRAVPNDVADAAITLKTVDGRSLGIPRDRWPRIIPA